MRSSRPLDPELAAGHEHDVGRPRQAPHLLALEQVRCDALDAVALELGAQAGLAEAGDADHAPLGRRAPRHAGERRPHLAAHAEDHDVAGRARKVGDQRIRRRGHEFLEMLDALEARGQCVQAHRSAPYRGATRL
ncbi:MAG: hypothetical protein M5U08_01615 [Burkholderiales bacterium]|nr:hypothetical protein [Burkholderiales bacterium]